MRTFKLVRMEDESGVSGTGVVAEGVEFSHGEVALSWLTLHRSMGFYPNIRELENIHGHGGRTVVRWDDLPVFPDDDGIPF